MKAIILAGGFGTRLRPLSCTRPKLLFPLANQPILDWTVKALAENGVDTVVLAVNYMAEAIVRHMGASKYGVSIIYSREERPLGTGGPIKRAEHILGRDEPFLAMNGDVVCEVDYRRMVEYHTDREAVATVALVEVERPERFGVAQLDEEDRIVRFVEKPKPEAAPSRLVNAGIYALSPEIFDYIPPGRPVSIEREVFPRLAERGLLYGYRVSGPWIDIGIPEDYLKANAIMLDRVAEKPVMGEASEVEAEVVAPTVLGAAVKVGRDSVVGPYVSVGDGVVIGRGCRIENSVVFPGAFIGDFTSIRNAIVGENAVLGRWVKVEGTSIIGDYVNVSDNVTITSGVSICPSKSVSESILKPGRVL